MSNGIAFARNPEEHGVLFETDKELKLLDKIVEHMVRYSYNVPITLELRDMTKYPILREHLINAFNRNGVEYVY